MIFLLYIIVGLLGALNTILWGLYGDLLAEKFEKNKIIRSIVIAIICALFIYVLAPSLPLFVVACSVIALERAWTEIYKAFLRVENQEKYKIPSDLGLKYPHPLIRPTLGIFLTIGLFGIFVYFPQNLNNLYIAFFAGLITALGGMLKDAPYEGFEPIKFFRSPLVSILIGLAIYIRYPQLDSRFFILAMLGGERVVSEFYKKIVKGKVSGKFKETKYNQWKVERKKLLLPYALTVLILISLLIV